MNSHSEEAARWFAASHRGVMLHDERQAYDAWRSVPENAARLAELQAIWDEIRPAGAVEMPIAAQPQPTGHARHLAMVVGFTVLMAGVLPRLDNGWWNTLDWWSR
jgi:ferric-dicitrate binding protein FerR (iron transport regulator)